MSIAAIRSFERRALLSDRTSLFLLGLFAAICLYALWSGAAHRSAIEGAVTAFVEAEAADMTAWRDRLVAVETGATEEDRWAGLALDATAPAVARLGVLADLSVGVSDLQPSTARVSQWRTVDKLFGNYQFHSPGALAAGPFDLAFVVIFIMPLIMIVLAYDALADDRERGRLGMILSQPISVRSLAYARLRVRLGAVLALLGGALALGFLLGAGDAEMGARAAHLTGWAAVALAYFAFWFMLIAWIVSMNRRSETTALLLTAIWAATCLASPAVLSAATEAAYPTPSRLAYLSEIRAEANEAYKARADVMQGMLMDHPELTVENYSLPEYVRTAFLVSRTVDSHVQPVLEEFDAVQAERSALLQRFQYASPAVLALQAFNQVAGTSLDRQKRFEREARAFKRALADRLEAKALSGERLTVAEYDALPEFQFEEAAFSSTLGRIATPTIFLAALAALFFALASGNLNRLQTRLQEQ